MNDHDAVVKFEKQVDKIEQDKIENEKMMENILEEIRTINQHVNSEKILSLQEKIEGKISTFCFSFVICYTIPH